MSGYLSYDEMTEAQRRGLVEHYVSMAERGYTVSRDDRDHPVRSHPLANYDVAGAVERPEPKRYIVELRKPKRGDRFICVLSVQEDVQIEDIVDGGEGIRAVIVEELT